MRAISYGKNFLTSAQSFCLLTNLSRRAVISVRNLAIASSLLFLDEIKGWSMLLGLEHFPIDDGDAEGEDTENFDPALWCPEDGDLDSNMVGV